VRVHVTGIALGLHLDGNCFASDDRASAASSYWCARVIHYPPLVQGDSASPSKQLNDQALAAAAGAEVERSVRSDYLPHWPLTTISRLHTSPVPVYLFMTLTSSMKHASRFSVIPLWSIIPLQMISWVQCVCSTPLRCCVLCLAIPLQVQLSCGEHTDYGLLTLVNQDPDITALQVLETWAQLLGFWGLTDLHSKGCPTCMLAFHMLSSNVAATSARSGTSGRSLQIFLDSFLATVF
jgi:hypothetical protein